MCDRVTIDQAAALLKEADRILILTHQYPDGDTLGSGYALCRALISLGKTVRVACADEIPEKYGYMTAGLSSPAFEPDFICAVDVADRRLLGAALETWADRIDLCIDHHGSHVQYARHLLLDASSAATAILIYQVIRRMGAPMNREIAECIYTGIATDTGCFKYANTSPDAHRIAAELMELDIRYDRINRVMFDIKSRARLELEQLALDSIRFYYGGRCAVMFITTEMVTRSGAGENDMEGLAPISRQIEGVWVGITLRQKADGCYKVSVRTGASADAAAICGRLGGGGHNRAAGCSLSGSPEDVVARLLEAVQESVPAILE